MAVKRCPACKQAIPSTKRPGRPPKLSRQLIAEFQNYLENGNFPEEVAEALGVGKTTLYRWLRAGRLPTEHREYKPIYRQFRDVVIRARARAKLNYTTLLAGAANDKDVQAIKFYLERTDPERWGRKDTLRVEQLVSREDLFSFFGELGEATRLIVEDGFALGHTAAQILEAIGDRWQEIYTNRIEAARGRAADAPALGAGDDEADDLYGTILQ